ncbi:hypothetical protein DPX39_100015000 [Trypanosoma brucei equiperdum]|uniref:Uncharacterized protein n=1 Tax=Trypanosoma brucei equiperdum TaxID=630700 RepID=A0A3L6L152_9TRYP|nr:hypothetical protein DPX39_100015000 [Trypanosoma brucei equiperdum]
MKARSSRPVTTITVTSEETIQTHNARDTPRTFEYKTKRNELMRRLEEMRNALEEDNNNNNKGSRVKLCYYDITFNCRDPVDFTVMSGFQRFEGLGDTLSGHMKCEEDDRHKFVGLIKEIIQLDVSHRARNMDKSEIAVVRIAANFKELNSTFTRSAATLL